jgi:hypothetical protein
MTDQRFEETLTRVLSEKAGWRAPADLRMRVASVPDEITPPGRLRGVVASVPRVARFAVVAVVVIVLAGSAWLRYETTAPGDGGTPLTIQTELAPTPLPSGAVWVCPQARRGPLRVERSGSELVFISTATEERESIVWPYGFSARLVDGRAELLASDGTVLAREGDVLGDLGGGLGVSGDAFHVCSVNGINYLP